MKVKLVGFDDRGKVRLSMKVVDQETGEDLEGRRRPKRLNNPQTFCEHEKRRA